MECVLESIGELVPQAPFLELPRFDGRVVNDTTKARKATAGDWIGGFGIKIVLPVSWLAGFTSIFTKR